MDLPFLDNTSKWPTAKDPDERIVSDKSPNEEMSLDDSLIDELFMALENKDASLVKDCLISLIHSLGEQN
jgi:hypothetical protein